MPGWLELCLIFPGGQRTEETPIESGMVSVLLILTVAPGNSLLYEWTSRRLGEKAQHFHGVTTFVLVFPVIIPEIPKQHSFLHELSRCKCA